MNKTLLLIAIWAINCYTSTGQCLESQAQEYLHGNDVKAIFRNGGDMFWDGASAQYNVPYTQGQNNISSIFAGALWLSAYDAGGNLSVAAQTYRSNGNDYWAGPLDSTGTAVSCSNFDKIWKVSGVAVRNLIQDFNDNGVIDNPVDSSVLAWPGKNNPHSITINGFALPNQDLAPFWDKNTDGIYNPMDGDYPIADPNHPTVIADDLLWSVFNDNGNLHSQSYGLALKAEIQLTAYAFNCIGDELINKTIFVKHKIINKSNLTWYDFKTGLWTDFDLGCGNDDYIGSIPAMNTVYTYNADNMDDTTCSGFANFGYGTNPPVQALTLLNQTMTNSMYYVNGPIGSDPTSAIIFDRLLSGVWQNGTPLTSGGDGYNPSNPAATPTDYIFPDTPNDSSGWSMAALQLSGLDQRALLTNYQDSLLAGGTFNMIAAYSYHRDMDSSNLQNVNLMYNQIPLVQQYFDNGYSIGNCSHVVALKKIQNATTNKVLKVYPNPTRDLLNVDVLNEQISSIELFNTLGKLVYQKGNIQNNTFQLSTQGLAQGMYILKVTTENEILSKQVVILQ